MSMQDDLLASAGRWAKTALHAYSEEPPDYDFAVHHMAVAVEHLSKAYLCSVSEVLLATDKPTLDDLLILAGHEDRTSRRRSDLRTIGGDGAVGRVEKLLGRKPTEGLRRLRETRNGITHLGLGEAASEARALLSAGITWINDLLTALDQTSASFWGPDEELTKQIVEQTVTDLQLRYQSKLHRAKENFELRFGHMFEGHRAAAIAKLSSIPVLTNWFLVVPSTCPACGSPAVVSGRELDLDDGPTWFWPRYFGCSVCGLTLEEDELELAGITGRRLNDHDNYAEREPDDD